MAREINHECSPGITWDGVLHEEADLEAHATDPWPTVITDLIPGKTWHPYLIAADVILVNPLIDGMNLVVKGAAALNDPSYLQDIRALLRREGRPSFDVTPAVIVASSEIGAREEIDRGALIVNPRDIPGIARALHAAVVMDDTERSRRAALVCEQVSSNQASDWMHRMTTALESVVQERRSGSRNMDPK
jgi:trehalose 6-phosphate synthase